MSTTNVGRLSNCLRTLLLFLALLPSRGAGISNVELEEIRRLIGDYSTYTYSA